MRRRIAWRRARKGDPSARETLVRQYGHLGDRETIGMALAEYQGRPGAFAQFVRWLEQNPPEGGPLATATLDAAEFMRATVIPNLRRTATTPWPVGGVRGKGDQGTASPKRPEVEPEQGSSNPFGGQEAALSPQVREEPTRVAPHPPTVAVAAPPAPPAPRPTPKPARVEVRPVTKPVRSTTGAKSSLSGRVHKAALGVALGACPRWGWESFGCVSIRIADGELVLFGRSDAAATWLSMPAETTGAAMVEVPRPGIVALRGVRGSGPVELSLYPDRVVAVRDGEPVLVPAREARLPRVPEIGARGGLIVAREKLAETLEADPEDGEVRLQWDRRMLRLNGAPVTVQYASGSSFEAILDARLLREAISRGTEAAVTVEVGGPSDPVILTSGHLTTAIASKCEAYL